MTLDDLPKKGNIRITKYIDFNHFYEDEYNNFIFKRLTVENIYSDKLPEMDINHIYYFYSINDNHIRYCKIIATEKEKKSYMKDYIKEIRREKLSKINQLL